MLIRAEKSAPGLYGDGSSGAANFDGTTTILGLIPSLGVYTLTADIFPTTMTVAASATIRLNGFVPFVSTQLNCAGEIFAGRNHGSGATGGAIITAIGTLATAAGNGGDGRSTTGAGTGGGGSGGRNIGGASSGAGGQADAGNAGGAGSTSASPTAIQGTARSLASVLKRRLMDNTSFNGSAGGGGGGVNVGTGTATSGGGGSGSIVGMVFAKRINNTGSINANGGNGAAATGTGNGKAGGGGAGAGGSIIVVTDQIISQGEITADAGTPGEGFGGGATGGTGTAGSVLIFTPQ